MRSVPWWGVLCSAAAPVLLIGGWTVAATRQPADFDSTISSISALAALGATDRGVMTAALAGLGVCHIATALALRPAATPGRMVLAAGGVATVLVSAFPLPAKGSSPAHVAVAGVAFLTLAGWPALATRRGPGVPWPFRRLVGNTAAAGLLALVGWFAGALAGDVRVGLAERVAAGAQATWPLIAVLGARRAATHAAQDASLATHVT